MATVFVGGSALLLAGAMAALAFGFANGEEGLVWTALIASGVAALFLVIAYVLSLREVKASRRATSAGSIPAITAPSEKPREEPKPEDAKAETTPDVTQAEDAKRADETPAPAA